MTRLTWIATILLCAASAHGQDSRPVPAPAKAAVQITAIKATGKQTGKVALPPDLDRVRSVLLKLGYDRYQKLSEPAVTGAKAAALVFELPEDHTATVVWTDFDKPGGDLQIEVTIEKPAADPAKGSEKVATLKVRAKNGVSFPVKLVGVWNDGDLLLVVTATRVVEKASEKKRD